VILEPLHTTLRDGTPVLIREVVPADAGLLRLGFDHLSEQSRQFRFFGAIKMLSEEQLEYFTIPSDRDHVAIGAAVEDGEALDPAGTARYVRLPHDPRAAEFALTIVDRHQRRGLGALLLGILARIACNNGIDRLIGYVMRRNRPMLNLMEAIGAERKPGPEDDIFEMVIPLHDDPAKYPTTPAGDAFRRADELAQLRPKDV
jgi:RimJ/RimL family protein N-acetyltransferase